jgi:hypothetical protein
MMTPLDRIEEYRQHLSEVVIKFQGDLLHPTVLAASQQLDTYIVRYMNARSASDAN